MYNTFLFPKGMNNDSTEAVTSIVSAVREAVGIDFKLMVDVQYAFDDADKVSEMIMEWENLGLDVFFIETPLRMDQISEIAKLHNILIENKCTTKIAFGEWQATHFEFEELVNSAKIDILQPDVGRVGGLTEAKRVLKLANVQDKLIVPHVWYGLFFLNRNSFFMNNKNRTEMKKLLATF